MQKIFKPTSVIKNIINKSQSLVPVVANQRDQSYKFNSQWFKFVPLALFALQNFNTAKCKGKANQEEISKEIEKILDSDINLGPTFVRLSWHSSGTQSVHSKSHGSSGGTIRHADELNHGANAGLAKMVSLLEPVYNKFKGTISFADLIVLAGVTSIKKMGGPTIGFRCGRKDKPIEDVPTEGRLPNADMGSAPKTNMHLRDVFGKMGFDDREIVALSGAHALGRCHPNASGFDGPWTPAPTSLNNYQQTLLLTEKWNPTTLKNGKKQFNNKDGLMMLPSDMALLDDPKFKYWVEVYSKDLEKFMQDFSTAFQKLTELGCKDLSECKWTSEEE